MLKQRGLSELHAIANVDGPAEQPYRQLGWTTMGIIPGYAPDTDGVTPHDTVIFFKELD